jgi:putative transposase
MPLGFEIGFEPPSELSVMRALRNSILSKAYVKERYADIENYWPAYGIPNTLVCDNGLEFHSHQLRRMCAELNIELQFCPKKQPQYKGAVERFLGTLNRAVCHSLPGTTFSNIRQRGEYNASNSAKISLNALKNLIHQWIVDIYCQRNHRITNRTPFALWNEGLKMIEPILPESLAQLDLILTREIKRKLSHQGVQLFGLFYNSSELSILRTRSLSTYEVDVRYDPENMASVKVYDELNGDYIQVDCIELEYASGLTLRQHRQIFKDAKQRGQLEQDDNVLLESKARFHKKIEDLSRNKLLRERKKAARDATPSAIKIPAWKSNPDFEFYAKSPVENLIQPMSFNVVTRGEKSK